MVMIYVLIHKKKEINVFFLMNFEFNSDLYILPEFFIIITQNYLSTRAQFGPNLAL